MQARSQKTRAAIVSAAQREFSERGYALTTAKSIAARAAVGTGTIYHYFSDKAAILREIVAERMSRLEAKMTSLAMPQTAGGEPNLRELRDRLRRDVRTVLAYHREDIGLHNVITERRLVDPALSVVMADAEASGRAQLKAALPAWGFKGDATATAFMVFSLLEGAVHNHVLTSPSLSDRRFIEGLVDAVLRVCASPEMLEQLASAP